MRQIFSFSPGHSLVILELGQFAKHAVTFEQQRSLNKERVDEIVCYQIEQIKQKGSPTFVGNILVASVRPLIVFDGCQLSEKLHIIDGQHRFEAMKCLMKFGLLAPNFVLVVEKLDLLNMDEVYVAFQDVNKCVPVPIHYLSQDQIVNQCTNMLAAKFTKAFSLNSRARRPQICRDEFKDSLIKADAVRNLNCETAKQLYDRIMELNRHFERKGCDYWKNTLARNNVRERKIIENTFKKCQANPDLYMFLGMVKNNGWLTDLLSG